MKTSIKPGAKTLIVSFAFLAIIIAGLIIFNNNQSHIQKLNSEKTELGQVLHERDSIVSDLLSAFDTIENNLTFINEKRSKLVVENSENRLSKNESLIADIRLMNTMLEESSIKIEELDKKLNSSGIQLQSFKNKIAELQKNIEQQNTQIAEFKNHFEEQNTKLAYFKNQNENLQSEVVSMRDSVNKKQQIIVEKEEIIVQKINELNKGFFASGTYKELQNNGILLKKGGFLGIGKNKILQNNFNQDSFTQIDISENKVIPLHARKVNLISDHPLNSYRFIEEDGLITKLEIEAPEDFWKISNYAVIEVKL